MDGVEISSLSLCPSRGVLVPAFRKSRRAFYCGSACTASQYRGRRYHGTYSSKL